MKTTEQFLTYLDNLNIKLWLEGDHLRCNAPKYALTSELKAELQTRKEEILHLIRKINSFSIPCRETITPVSRPENIPLSFAQQRLWFVVQLEHTSPFYNEFVALRLSGQLNISIFKQSLEELIRRHEPLRTTFNTDSKGKPLQIIHPAAEISLPIINLEQLDLTIQQQEIEKLVTQEAQKVFNLEQDLLLRVIPIKLNSLEHIVLITTHHIVSDGWSIGIFIQELSSLYSAFAVGEPSPLAELPIQYADFALWQRQWLSGKILETQLDYWQQQLQGVPELLQLPTDRPRPHVQTYRGATQSFSLNAELTQKLQVLSRKSGSTLFMTLMAGFATLLYRYSGQTDIAIGSPIANRNRSEIESLIGFFVNTLVLRSNLADNPSIQELLAQVRETTLKAYEHQDVPFEKLVEVLQPQRSLSHSPLFQVMFVLQNAPMEEMKLPGVTLAQLECQSTVAMFDLTLSVTETKQGLEGEWEYNTDLFDGSTIERMSKHFQVLLEAMVENLQQRVSELSLLSQAERQQLLVEWNDTEVNYPKDKCIHELFEVQVEKTPDAVAVVFEDERLTYAQLNARANQLAHYLHKKVEFRESNGSSPLEKPERLVGICVERSFEMLIGILGILKAGFPYVPIDPNYASSRINYILSDAEISLLITQAKLSQQIPSLESVEKVFLDTDWQIISTENNSNLACSANLSNLAYSIYTSGSTGTPKGVLIQHNSLVNFVSGAIDQYKITKSDRILQFASISFDVAVEEIYPSLITGGTVILANSEMFARAEVFISKCRQLQITVLDLPTAYWQQLVSEIVTDHLTLPGCIRLVIIGGEQVNHKYVRQWQDYIGNVPQLINAYGPTEATVETTVYSLTNGSRGKLPIGKPLPNVRVYVLDSHLQPVPIGVVGELYIGGIGVARGYLNRPELTAEKFIANPFSQQAKDRLYRTGDLVRYLTDGNLEFLGRVDHQVKIRGFRIELGEIEAVLNTHPEIQQNVVVATEDLSGDKRLIAYVVGRNELFSTYQLRDFLKQELPDYMIPAAFIPMKALPLTPNGKVNRQALPKTDNFSRELETKYIRPQNDLEKSIATIWQKALKVEKVGIHDNFFELGGHSLLMVQVHSQLRKIYQQDLTIIELFRYPTISSLAKFISRANNDDLTNIAQAKVRTQQLDDGKARMKQFLKKSKGIK
jgi:amino acid adenylation domain-containing protein